MRLSSILKNYAKKKETPIQLKYLYNKNPIKNQSVFLQEELSIRLSHRIFDLLKLPYGLPTIPEIKSVINLYHNSFEKINSIPKLSTTSNIELFTNTVETIKNKHHNLEYTIAKGLQKLDNPLIDYSIINNVLNTFFLSRISIRTLISHQINTFNNLNPVISECCIDDILFDTISDIKYIANRHIDYEPNINVTNYTNQKIKLHYVNSHLYYIFNELLKNSVIAHSKYNIEKPINIILNETNNYIIINISDKGKGFNIDKLEKILSYSYSTSPINDIDNINNSYIISGLGFGLPLTNLYIKYFGGKMTINPIENIGTNIYIYIKKNDISLREWL